jgi:arylsulfatase
MGKGGEITLRAGGKTVAGGRIEHSAPIRLAIFEGLDIGLDNGSPVDWTYKLPFKFTGRIDKVTVEVFPGK